MMNIIIFGAGKSGKHLYDEIKNNSVNLEVLGFADNILSGEYQDKQICKPEIMFPKYKDVLDAVFIAAGAQKTVKIIIDTVRAYGIENIYMLHDVAGKNRLPLFDEQGNMLNNRIRKIHFSSEKPTIPYFEVPITDKCNLNCKGCLFACNGIDEYENVPYEQIEKDAVRMSELFYDIPWIRILGGEPLLHPDILKILAMYRRVFPDSEIDLCTNGLLIPKMQKNFFDCLKENQITVHVSGYKPTYGILNRIDDILKQQGIDYTVLKREEFAKYYTLNSDNDAEKSFRDCIASGCREVYRGRLIRCSGVIAFEKLNQKYGTQYKIDSDDWFDIHCKDIDAWEIKKKIDEPSNACRYCNVDKIEFFKWDYANNGEGLDDYII